MANKYMRGLPYTTVFFSPAHTNESALNLKLIYEFWGYCVNGGSSLTVPGGFPSVSYTGGGIPANFTEGNPSDTLASNYTLPTANIAVNNASAFPLNGTLLINGNQFVNYTGVSGNTFTGCTGGSGAVTTGESVVGLVFLGSGTDGATIAGTSIFSAVSAPFNQNMVGKYLVMWVPGSGSTDDSIYQITSVPTASSIIINPNNGGTPSNTTQHPIFTTRSNIHYRIVDVVAACQLNGIQAGNYMVFQLNSPSVNPGQAFSQVQIFLRQQTQGPPWTGAGPITQNLGLVGSPSGSWNGTVFTGTPSTTLNGSQNLNSATLNVVSTNGFPGSGTLNIDAQSVPYTGITTTSFTGCTGPNFSASSGDTVTLLNYNDTMFEQYGQTNGNGSYAGDSISSAYITMIADSDFFLMHSKNSLAGFNNNTTGTIIHVETPFRLYPRNNDPNPFTVMTDGFNGINTVGNNSTVLDNYGGGFAMVGTDFVTRHHNLLTKCLGGDGSSNAGVTPSGVVPGQGMISPLTGFNIFNGTAISSEVVLSTFATPTQFCYARCKLKNVRMAGPYIPSYHRIGNNGQYIHLINGVCWPWDNTILPYNLMPGGF